MSTQNRWRRAGVAVAGVATIALAQAVAGAGAAQAAPPTSVWIQGSGLQVLSPAGQANYIYTWQSGAQVYVRDTVGTLAGQFPCVPADAHTVRCPAAPIAFFIVDTGDGNDRVINRLARTGRIVTGAGNDYVDDGPANQGVLLGSGNDSALVGFGRDSISGGTGFDAASYANRAAGVSLRLDGSANDGQAGEQDNVFTDVEYGVGGNGNDVIVGSNFNNRLYGLGGHDQIFGLGGHDYLDGGTGTDQQWGGTGVDTVSYAGRAAAVQVRLDNLANDGQAGENDNARPDNENVIGGNGADLLVGSNANNNMHGMGGNDSLHGLGGNDVLYGDTGSDFGAGYAGADGCATEVKHVTCEF